ncbi:MAG: sulfatase [Pseudomonadota bacterium]
MALRFTSVLGISIAMVVSLLGCEERKAPEPAARVSPPEPAPPPEAPSAAPPPEPTPRGPAEPLNVLLITIDSLRADMPWTGYPRPIAPNLTELANDSVVYPRAYSASSYTAKSVATLLTGRFASTLYRDGYFFAKYSSANLFFPEILSERGIASFSWHAHLYFQRGKGLDQGFTEWRLVPGITFNPNTDEHVTSEKMTKLGIELLDNPKLTDGQFFAWAHYMDPHDQYVKHEESPDFGRKNRDRYDSEVWHTDYWVGKLLEFARQKPWWKKTVLIVSADHGEAFGEHGMYKHAFEVWEVLTRVPLIVHGGGITPRRIEQRRSHIDLAPTILELMKVPVPDGMQGKSLVPELYGAEPESREPILVELAEDSHNPPRRALISGRYKIIDFGRNRFELYDLEADPGEEKNLAKELPEELARMRALLAEKYATLPTVAPYGGMKLREGGIARGPSGPPKTPESAPKAAASGSAAAPSPPKNAERAPAAATSGAAALSPAAPAASE